MIILRDFWASVGVVFESFFDVATLCVVVCRPAMFNNAVTLDTKNVINFLGNV